MFKENLNIPKKNKEISQNQLDTQLNVSKQTNKILKFKRNIVIIIGMIVLFACIGAIYNLWNNMFYEFGKNLYYLINC